MLDVSEDLRRTLHALAFISQGAHRQLFAVRPRPTRRNGGSESQRTLTTNLFRQSRKECGERAEPCARRSFAWRTGTRIQVSCASCSCRTGLQLRVRDAHRVQHPRGHVSVFRLALRFKMSLDGSARDRMDGVRN
jgi:hypothetical protein